MPLDLEPGYNLVTERAEETDAEYGAVEFFRAVATNEDLPHRFTVTGLEDLLYDITENERSETISQLRSLLRETKSIGQFTTVQFLIDGRLSPADRFQIHLERQGETVILNVGELFVAEPNVVAADHAIAPK